MLLTCFQSSAFVWAFSSYVVKWSVTFIATNAVPVSASCHVISCELSNSATVTVGLCVDRVNICSTRQKVSRTSRTWGATLAPDRPTQGSSLKRGVDVRCEAGWRFDADWGSNFFQNLKLQRWWRCLLTIWSEKIGVWTFVIKEEVPGEKWRSTILST